MNIGDRSMGLLAVASGDTVKLFDISADSGDPCALSYSPSPGFQVHSVKWNHTNLVLASAGGNNGISLWRKSGQSMGTISFAGSDSGTGDGIEESLLSISFCNKGSRYICSGGTGQVVRIWDLQRKRCIKLLSGHTDTITGAMYNCKDEYLASVSLKGDLILHNLTSGVKVAELKDPYRQVLRMLDYSRISRQLLVTAGDDGSVHLWDTTAGNLKASWLKQHSAPTSGVSFSPSNDKIIFSVGLDKKLYTFDSGVKRPSFLTSYEAPFTSLALRDDAWMLAAGTSNGTIVFYDIRAKPQPFTVLRAYKSSEAITCLSWERSKPVILDDSNCTAEVALLGGATVDSILMPDPLPHVTSSGISPAAALPDFQNYVPPSMESSLSGTLQWKSGTLAKLNAPARGFKDEMDVFSPLMNAPPLDKFWDDHGNYRKESQLGDRKPFLPFPSSGKRFPMAEDVINDNPIFNWKSSASSRQDDFGSLSLDILGSTPAPSTKNEDLSLTPPEAWGAVNHHPAPSFPSRFSMLTPNDSTPGTVSSRSQGLSFPTDQSLNLNPTNSSAEDDISSSQDTTRVSRNHSFSSLHPSLGARSFTASGGLDSPRTSSLYMPQRFSTYAERISATGDAAAGSPKAKKLGVETRDELPKSLLSKSNNASLPSETETVPPGGAGEPSKPPSQPDPGNQNSFTFQLLKQTFEETLASFEDSIYGDVRNVHIEIIRQFHLHETEMASALKMILQNQAEIMKEIQSIRKENQHIRQLL